MSILELESGGNLDLESSGSLELEQEFLVGRWGAELLDTPYQPVVLNPPAWRANLQTSPWSADAQRV